MKHAPRIARRAAAHSPESDLILPGRAEACRKEAMMRAAERWERAWAERDPAYDGVFFVCVRSTGIYCRCVCPVRLPFRRNVDFVPSAAAAEAAGFRPCLRCRPETAPFSPAWKGTLATVERAFRLIVEEGALDAEGASVDALATRLGMTERHLRRLSGRHLGATPTAVARTARVQRAKRLLSETDLPITQIAWQAGFRSVRRFNQVFATTYRRPPGAIRRAVSCPPAPPAG
ncbi:Ada metal-binding domain-containing protein [Pseudoroseomonas cervicalis]|uniref:Ada metal-binding domain-containing protein n=1 Tax=Teichococcus cervicalis TaxID=204525 RepID=UPI0022F16C36|nr:Ada metal-binding domain-containing protein [Pseudoroseomonas cervicalis]WBV43465.1 helix-turn-helix domain-containing protein [Pseudoroseomonas cervicalis]